MNLQTFSEGPPVPLLVEGLIDAVTLQQLFTDLGNVANMLNIREKGHARDYASVDELTVETALDRLLKGASRAIQLRYQFDGHEWTDTILSLAPGFRVVRCRHESDQASHKQ